MNADPQQERNEMNTTHINIMEAHIQMLRKQITGLLDECDRQQKLLSAWPSQSLNNSLLARERERERIDDVLSMCVTALRRIAAQNKDVRDDLVIIADHLGKLSPTWGKVTGRASTTGGAS